ncbi:MAG: DegV family protein [Defluviitaleaceae bacterium]|nr:DegV family protein [Defluviitaleaceae bacterium]
MSTDYIIFADSTTDLPAQMAESLGVHLLPYIFTLDGRDYYDYHDYRDLPIKDFYNALRGGKMSTTTLITVHRFMEAWRPFLEAGKDILYMSLSSMLSKTYDQSVLAAREAMEAYPDRRVITIDTKSASLGQGCLAVKAAGAKADGKTLEETAIFIEQTISKLHVWVMADDLHHLKRGGRISGAKAALGTMLNVKPILNIIKDGRLVPVGKVRGRNKAMSYFLERMDEYEIVQNETIYIAHSDDIELAHSLRDMVIQKYGNTDIIINNVGPVIGTHTGPGTVGVMFIGNDRKIEGDI